MIIRNSTNGNFRLRSTSTVPLLGIHQLHLIQHTAKPKLQLPSVATLCKSASQRTEQPILSTEYPEIQMSVQSSHHHHTRWPPNTVLKPYVRSNSLRTSSMRKPPSSILREQLVKLGFVDFCAFPSLLLCVQLVSCMLVS